MEKRLNVAVAQVRGHDLRETAPGSSIVSGRRPGPSICRSTQSWASPIQDQRTPVEPLRGLSEPYDSATGAVNTFPGPVRSEPACDGIGEWYVEV